MRVCACMSYVVYIRCVAYTFVRAYGRACIFGLRCMCACVRALSFAQPVFVVSYVVFTIDLTIQCSDP